MYSWFCRLGASVTWSYEPWLQPVHQGTTRHHSDLTATLDIFKRNTGTFYICWQKCKLLAQSSLHLHHRIITTFLLMSWYPRETRFLAVTEMWNRKWEWCGPTWFPGVRSRVVPTGTCIPLPRNYDGHRVKQRIVFLQFIWAIFFFKYLVPLFGPNSVTNGMNCERITEPLREPWGHHLLQDGTD